jgi:hypothetical protein
MKYEAPYMLSLEELKTWIERLGARLEIDHQSLPAYNQELPAYARVGEGVYIEVDDHRYHYVGMERGVERDRFTTPDLDALLERVFCNITFNLAFKYEARHRAKQPRDCRRMAFQLQVELLSQLSSDWAEREIQRHEEILQKHPFDDFAGVRAQLCKLHRDQGKTSEEAEKLAYEKYPRSRRTAI